MPFTTPYTFTALETLTAAKLNTIQDNIAALWAGTTAGDTDYYTSSTTKSRLAIGAAGTFKKSTGSAPSWANINMGDVGKKLVIVYNNADISLPTPNGTLTNITFNSESVDVDGWHSTSSNTNRIIPLVAGYYEIDFGVYIGSGLGCQLDMYINNSTKIDSASGNYGAFIRMRRSGVLLNGSTDYINFVGQPTNGSTITLSYLANLSLYCTVNFMGV